MGFLAMKTNAVVFVSYYVHFEYHDHFLRVVFIQTEKR